MSQFFLSSSFEIYSTISSYLGEDSGIAQIMTRLDDALATNGIDSTSCMQRVACSYSKQAAETLRKSDNDNGSMSTLDKLIDTVSTSPMFRTALEGTAVQEALETGRKGQNCARVYRQCGFSAETIITMLAKLAASNSNTPTSAWLFFFFLIDSFVTFIRCSNAEEVFDSFE